MYRFAGAACAWAIFLAGAAAADAQDALTGKMAQYAHLLGGSWSCTTQVPATGATAAHEDRSTAIFVAAPGGVLHDHIGAEDYSGDFYIGFDVRTQHYWLTGADTLGTDISLVSSDGLHFSGTSSMGGIVMNDRATYTNLTPDRTQSHEVFTRPGVEAIFDTSCTRS